MYKKLQIVKTVHDKKSKQQILKPSCYRNYCIDQNQILHSDKNHKAAFAGGPNMSQTNPWGRTAAIFKNRKIAMSQKTT